MKDKINLNGSKMDANVTFVVSRSGYAQNFGGGMKRPDVEGMIGRADRGDSCVDAGILGRYVLHLEGHAKKSEELLREVADRRCEWGPSASNEAPCRVGNSPRQCLPCRARAHLEREKSTR